MKKFKLFPTILLILLATLNSCKITDPINEMINTIIEGYWSDLDGLVVEFVDDEGFIVEFGESNLGSNSQVFDYQSQPYIRNIKLKQNNTWEAEIVIGTYNNEGKLTSISHDKTTLTMSGSGDTKMMDSKNANGTTSEWIKMDDDFIPQTPCFESSKTHREEKNQFIFDFSSNGNPSNFENFTLTYGWKKDFSGNFCNFYIRANNLLENAGSGERNAEITLAHSPKAGTYKITDGLYGPMGSNMVASLNYNGNYRSESDKGTITIAEDGGKWKITGTNIIVNSTAYSNSLVSFTLYIPREL